MCSQSSAAVQAAEQAAKGVRLRRITFCQLRHTQLVSGLWAAHRFAWACRIFAWEEGPRWTRFHSLSMHLPLPMRHSYTIHHSCIYHASPMHHPSSMHHYYIIYQPSIIHTPRITHVSYTHHPTIHHICIINHAYISYTSCVIYASPVTHASSTHQKAFMHHSWIISTSYIHHPPCITMNHHHWSPLITFDHHNRLCRPSPHGLIHHAIAISYDGTTVLAVFTTVADDSKTIGFLATLLVAHDTNAAHTHTQDTQKGTVALEERERKNANS